MSKIAENLIELIGNTPLVSLGGYCKENGLKGNVIAKVEYFNPLGSVKDRAALYMIDDAKKRGLLKSDSVIIEPTSGNTGVGLAYIAAIRGYKLILIMPESMSIERRKLLKMLGAEIVLTPAEQGMGGAISKANELVNEYPNSFIPNQFENPANALAHKMTTAKEIIADTDGKIDYFVAGVGSGGTITGVGKALKDFDKNIKIVAVEPFSSAVISGENKGSHGLQGIGAGFIPKLLDVDIIDEVIKVKDNEAMEAGRQIAKTDGLLVGISSGAAIYAASVLANRPENAGKNIVVLLPDTGERYLSTALFE
ncbi:MAG TPA: cysteine synthase A [Lachnospiraceae bacterium]|nr:cysteine synthase A [Lachnospiraceae bacterium]